MTLCPEYETLFWSDIHGVLDPSERDVWEKHLSICPACRHAKITAAQELGIIKEAIVPSPLSGKALNAAIHRIENRMGKKRLSAKTEHAAEKRRWFHPALWVPVATGVCLVIFSIVVFNLNPKAVVPEPVAAVSVFTIHDEIQKEDMEVISNLELLTEFESIQKIVQAVDHAKETKPSSTRPEPLQGKRFGGGKVIYG
ncbi:MAG: zf-HC2 domain-containing protein [Desulfobacterales bacterium]|jgi:anti-sigma factor RsiW|nr:zf-HC2 domain-containing protein [Desulfobacterales bacterium]